MLPYQFGYGNCDADDPTHDHRLKLHDLHILMTVVRAGTMSKAAEQLNTSQPAISRSIAELEHALGVQLLNRNRQGVAPTEYGRALLDCGIAVFDDLRQGMRTIEYLAQPSTGEVRIGCSLFMAASFVSAIIDRLHSRYPGIEYHLLAAPVEKLYPELRERNVDFLIGPKADDVNDEKIRFETLYDDPCVVVAGEHHRLARRRKLEFAKLAQESWVLPSAESLLGAAFREAFRASGCDYPRPTVVATPLEVRLSLLATGRFLTISPLSALRFPNKLRAVKVLPVRFKMPRVPTGIISLKSRTLSPVARLVIQTAREVLSVQHNGMAPKAR